jgi:hypothetical protein
MEDGLVLSADGHDSGDWRAVSVFGAFQDLVAQLMPTAVLLGIARWKYLLRHSHSLRTVACAASTSKKRNSFATSDTGKKCRGIREDAPDSIAATAE